MENVNVVLGALLTVDLTMTPGGMTETVEVTAAVARSLTSSRTR